MSAGFGWSISDVVLLAKTTHKIIAALKCEGGAASAYQKTFRSLESLQLTLTEIQTILVNTDPRFRNAIRAQVDISTSSIAAFNSTLYKKYGAALSTSAPTGALSGSLKKAKWALLAAEDVAAFQAELSGQLEVVKMLMTMQLCTAVEEVKSTVTANGAISTAIGNETRAQTDEVLLEIHTAHNDLQSSLSNLEGIVDSNRALLQLRGADQEALQRMESQMTNLHHDLNICTSTLNNSALAHHKLILAVIKEQESHLRKIDQNNAGIRCDHDRLFNKDGSSREPNQKVWETFSDGLEDISFSFRKLKQQQDDNDRLSQPLQITHGSLTQENTRQVFHNLPGTQRLWEVLEPSSAARAQENERSFSIRQYMLLRDLYVACSCLISTKLRQLFNRYLYLSPQLYLLCRTVSRFLPHPRSMPPGDVMRFEDALGTVRDLPLAYFQYYDVFEAFLRNDFKNKPGYLRVRTHCYHLLDSNGHTIAGTNWATLIRPGAKIFMSMIIFNMFIDFKSCPMCGGPLRSIQLLGGYYCQCCNQSFYLQHPNDIYNVSVLPELEETEISDSHRLVRKEKEWSIFKHMHLARYDLEGDPTTTIGAVSQNTDQKTGKKNDSSPSIWYCGSCNGGPMSLKLDIYCWQCQRQRDGYALYE